MKLQDYIHHYIGCRCVNTWFPEGHERYNDNWVLHGYVKGMDKPYCLVNNLNNTWTDSIKPILRKLEDITDEECNEYNKLMWTVYSINKHQDQIKTDAATTTYLIDQGFDLFGLIEADLAIDSKTLK